MVKPGPFGTKDFNKPNGPGVCLAPLSIAVSDLQASSLAPRAAESYRNRPEPIPFLHILAVNDREDVRGEHGPLT
jgi:hypothetical protein